MISSVPPASGVCCVPAPVDVMGVPVTPFETYDHALRCIEAAIVSGRKVSCLAVNPIKIHWAWQDPALLHLLRQTEMCLCDGVGVSIAAKILSGRTVPRITGCDLFFRLLAHAAQRQWGVYLLGASAPSNATARAKLSQRYPGLRIVGGRDGYFDDPQAVIRQINASGAHLLFVALGSPRQEHWIWRHRAALEASFCMGVGGSLDVASGRLRRAPAVFRRMGTEFLFRFALEPRKRLIHQAILLRFLLRVLGQKWSGAGGLTGGAREIHNEP